MRINTIRLHNYRAFYPQFDANGQPEPYEIAANGKNVLIYGENGAGKTSLFRAVRDFFFSSHGGRRYTKNHFVPPPTQPEEEELPGRVEIVFDNNSHYAFTSSVPTTSTRQTALQQSQRASGFLTYVELIKTYLADGQNNQPPELFDLLINNILHDHSLPPSSTLTVGEEWNQLDADVNAHRRSLALKARLNADGTVNCNTFNVGLNSLLKGFTNPSGLENEGIEAIVNRWLFTYFRQSIEIEFIFEQARQGWDDNKRRKVRQLERSLKIAPKLYGSPIPNDYHSFLNEARLSALAICIFLASLRTYPKDPTRLNVLYLDDVFIGLDMSNRLPLLDILKNEFADYQIFLSTYDRAWFEVAKTQLRDWQTVEMYSEAVTKNAGTNSSNQYEQPIIITPSETDYYKNARSYLKRHDYPACANALRKALERAVKDKLPNSHQQSERHLKLEELLNRLRAHRKDCSFPLAQDVMDRLTAFKGALLNPMSHDDIKSPIYKRELDDTFQLIDDIRNLPALTEKTVVAARERLTYTNQSQQYEIVISPINNLIVVSDGITQQIKSCQYRVERWCDGGIDFGKRNTNGIITRSSSANIESYCARELTLEQIGSQLCINLDIQQFADLYAEFFTPNGKSMRECLA